MPRKTTAYLCAFKCGRRATVKRKAVEDHESRCSMNPARRSCKTCAHDVRDGSEGIHCAIDAKPAFVPKAEVMAWDESELIPEGPERSMYEGAPLTLMYDCPSWVAKEMKEGRPRG